MANPKITAELLLSTDMRNAAQEIDRGLTAVMRHHAKDVKKTVGGAWKDAIELAMGEGKSGKAMRDFVKSGIVEAAETYSSLMKKQRVYDAQVQKELLQQRAKAFKKEIDARRQAFEELQERQLRTTEETVDGFKDGAEKFANIIKGDFGGILDVLRGSGRGLLSRGRATQQRVALAQEGGADPAQVSQMAKMGRTLAKIGTSLAAVAAVAGAVIVLVKLFADLESKAKEINKTLLDSAGAADFGLGHVDFVTGGLNDRLAELRNSTEDLNDAFFKFGALAKEQQTVLTSFNQAGFTFAKMTAGMETAEERADGYAKALNAALTYSRALGISSSETAQKMGELTFETGQGLQEIGEQFSVITSEALRAGFVTKRFYSAVVEATSGMAFYGVRLEETTKLLSGFQSLLGEAMGPEAFKSLVGQYRDKDERGKLRDIIVKGQGYVAEELGRAFELRVAELQRDFSQRLGGQDVAKMLASMTEEQLRTQLEAGGFKPEEIRRFVLANRLGKGRSGGLPEMMEAMGGAGPGFDLAMALQASQVFQGRSVGEVVTESRGAGAGGAAMRIALGEVAEAQGMKLDQMVELLGNADARWSNLIRIQRDIQKHQGDRTRLSREDQEYLTRMENKFGIEISTLGEKITKDDLEMTSAMDLVRTSSVDSGKKLSDQFTRDQEIAVGISENIYGLNEIMEQTIAKILNDIYGVVSAIARKFLAGTEEMEKVSSIERARRVREEKQEALALKRDRLREIDVKLRMAEGDEREKLLKAREQTIEEQKKITEEISRAQVIAKALGRAQTKGKTLEAGELALKEAGVGGRRPSPAELEMLTQSITGQNRKTVGSAGLMPWDVASAKITGLARGERTITAWEDVTPEDIVKEMRANYEKLAAAQRRELERLYGGPANIERAFEEAAKAMKEKAGEIESIWVDEASEYNKFMGVASGAFKTTLLEGAGMGPGQGAVARHLQEGLTSGVGLLFGGESQDLLRQIATNTNETKKATETGIMLDMSNAKQARDLILPAGGGAPIFTDERDTLVAARPGGPVAKAMGGGKGVVNVNVYGGDTKKIYDTVMRALKATGNA